MGTSMLELALVDYPADLESLWHGWPGCWVFPDSSSTEYSTLAKTMSLGFRKAPSVGRPWLGKRISNFSSGVMSPRNEACGKLESASKEIAASSVKLLPVTELEVVSASMLRHEAADCCMQEDSDLPSLRQQSAFVGEQEASLTQSSQSDSCKAA
eukprot:g49528.t1